MSLSADVQRKVVYTVQNYLHQQLQAIMDDSMEKHPDPLIREFMRTLQIKVLVNGYGANTQFIPKPPKKSPLKPSDPKGAA